MLELLYKLNGKRSRNRPERNALRLKCSLATRLMKIVSLLLSLLCVTRASAGTNENPPKLLSYNIDVSKITVSGLSSGGFFAVQFHVAYSKIIQGVGVIAGGPFWCAQNNVYIATGPCERAPYAIPDCNNILIGCNKCY